MTAPRPANLRELQARYDRVATLIAEIIERGGQDPDVVLDRRLGELTLRALTVPGDSALYFVVKLRKVLLTSPDPDEEIARQFVAAWRAQVRLDESI